MSDKKLLVVIPTRSRPSKFQEVFTRLQQFLSGNNEVLFCVNMDTDDTTMNTPEIREWFGQFKNTVFYYGNSKTKVEACNANISGLIDNYDAVLLTSDDMIPRLPGYDDAILSNLFRFFKNGDGVLHFNDGRQGSRLDTLPIMGTTYYKRFGYIYHPDYVSVYCDNEMTEVAQKLGKIIYFDTILMEHGWMNYIGKDELFERNENPELYKKDKQTFEERKAAGFPAITPSRFHCEYTLQQN